MRGVCSAVQQWQLGAWACGQSSTARAGVWCVFRSTFPGVPPPPSPPRVPEKRGGSQATAHNLFSCQKSFYALLHDKLQQSYLKPDYICSMGYDFWMRLIDELYTFGKIIGKSHDEVTAQNDCYLIGIYECFSVYDKAYDAMVMMAKTNRHWILIRRNTILWAKEQCLVWKLRSAIEARLKDYSKDCNRENFSKALDEIRGIVGY